MPTVRRFSRLLKIKSVDAASLVYYCSESLCTRFQSRLTDCGIMQGKADFILSIQMALIMGTSEYSERQNLDHKESQDQHELNFN